MLILLAAAMTTAMLTATFIMLHLESVNPAEKTSRF